jgi:MFS family permease
MKFFQERENLWKISISRMLAMGAEQLAWSFFPLFILELGGTTSSIAMINIIGTFSSILAAPIGGYVADLGGRVKLLGYGTLAYSLCSILYFFANDWKIVAFIIFFQMLFRIYMPALDAILADSIKVTERGKGYAFSDTVSTIPSIIAPTLIGIIAERYSINTAVKFGFCSLAIFGSLSAYIRFSLKETATINEKLGKEKTFNLIFKSYKNLLILVKESVGNLKLIIILCFLLSIFNSAVGPYWIVYAKEEIRLTTSQWGIIVSIGSIMRVILLYPLGIIIDKIDLKKIIIFSLLSLAACPILFINSNTFLSTIIVFIIIHLLNLLLSLSSSSMFAKNTSINNRGSVVSAIDRGQISLLIGGGFLSGGVLLFPAKIFGYKLGDVLFQSNKSYPWVLSSLGFFIILILVILFLD